MQKLIAGIQKTSKPNAKMVRETAKAEIESQMKKKFDAANKNNNTVMSELNRIQGELSAAQGLIKTLRESFNRMRQQNSSSMHQRHERGASDASRSTT